MSKAYAQLERKIQKNSTPNKSDVLPKNEIKLSESQFHLLTVRYADKKTYYVIID